VFGLPLFFFILINTVMFIQIGMARQSLEQAAYAAARAAVVQPDKAAGYGAATMAADAVLNTSGTRFTPTVQLTEAAGVSYSGTPSGVKWEKGSLLHTEVSISFIAFGTRREVNMKSEIVLMIERPAPRYG
jgi:hypothetical protein